MANILTVSIILLREDAYTRVIQSKKFQGQCLNILKERKVIAWYKSAATLSTTEKQTTTVIYQYLSNKVLRPVSNLYWISKEA